MQDLSHLLFRGESESLDFKREQYRFAGADESGKAELLKDILAMANAWRNEDAYILIGVEEKPEPTPVGLNVSLDDAAIQQFVNSKTQKPINFNYFETQLSGVLVGVIRIPIQERPFFLRKRYVSLAENAVYIRRGSSTAVALPDEIARMGMPQNTSDAVLLSVDFADYDARELRGKSVDLKCKKLEIPAEIPRFEGHRFASMPANRHFFRDGAEFLHDKALLRPIAITVTNTGENFANNVRVELWLDDPDKTWVIKSRIIQEAPEPYLEISALGMRNFKPLKERCEIEFVGQRWLISFDAGDLQARRTVWPAIRLFVGASRSGRYTLSGRVLAKQLPQPHEFSLEFAVDAEQVDVSLEDLEQTLWSLYEANKDTR